MGAVCRVLAGGISRFGRRIFSTYRSQASAKAKPTSFCRYMPVFCIVGRILSRSSPDAFLPRLSRECRFRELLSEYFRLAARRLLPGGISSFGRRILSTFDFVVKHRSEAAPGSLRLLSVVL